MSTIPQPVSIPQTVAPRTLPEYTRALSDLLKPRVTSLVVMTAWAGYYLGCIKAGHSSLNLTLLHTLLGIGFVSGGASALNQVLECEVDSRMKRTELRPLPTRRLSVITASLFGMLFAAGGSAYLAVSVNQFTGFLALMTAAAYVGMYTPLKQVSPWCTFVGAFPGAMPPLLGWTAARGILEWEAVALFAILFFWQFPHFHAIAWMYRDDYERGGVRMLPVVNPDGRTTLRSILLYSIALIPVSILPTLLHMAGWIYAIEAFLLGIGLLVFGIRLSSLRQSPGTPQSRLRARHLLQASVLYLPILLILLMLSATF